MRVLIAPDDFKGTLSAVQAAEAIAAGWARHAPDDVLLLRPMSDGGPGFVSVVEQARGGQVVTVVVTGPMGDPVPAAFLLDGGTAYVESAQACGLHLVAEGERDACRATSRGVGELLLAALEAGATRIVVGLGGSSTTDAGAGLLAALGAQAWDAARQPVSLTSGGIALADVVSVDVGPARARFDGIELVIATDVDSPLLGARGAARGFAPQKGADDAAVDDLEAALVIFAAAVGRTPAGKDPAVALGSGAAGGQGYALLHLGGQRVAGIDTVRQIVDLDACIASCDLVITGEGCFDWQSLRGKVVAGVAGAALAQARPAVVIAGRVEVGRREYAALGIAEAVDVPTTGHPADDLARRTTRLAAQWSRRPSTG